MDPLERVDSSFPWRADERAGGLGGRRRRSGGAPRLQGAAEREESGSPSKKMGACCSWRGS